MPPDSTFDPLGLMNGPPYLIRMKVRSRAWFKKVYPPMNNESQEITLLKQLLDAWTNGVDGDEVANIMDRIGIFLDAYDKAQFSCRPAGESCCGDPGDCACLDEPGYGSGV